MFRSVFICRRSHGRLTRPNLQMHFNLFSPSEKLLLQLHICLEASLRLQLPRECPLDVVDHSGEYAIFSVTVETQT